MTNLHSNARDVTAVIRQAQPTPPTAHYLAWLCGHKGPRLGGHMRGRLPMKCAACVEKAK